MSPLQVTPLFLLREGMVSPLTHQPQPQVLATVQGLGLAVLETLWFVAVSC